MSSGHFKFWIRELCGEILISVFLLLPVLVRVVGVYLKRSLEGGFISPLLGGDWEADRKYTYSPHMHLCTVSSEDESQVGCR